IDKNLLEASKRLDDNDFQEALNLINEAESLLKNYHGPAVTEIINDILMLRNEINIANINDQLHNKPSIDTLKNLLWEAEALKTDVAEELTDQIRNEIIDYTFSKASE